MTPPPGSDIVYRPARVEDTDALVGLWVAANPGTDPEQWRAEWLCIPDAAASTFVATTSGDRVASVVHFALHDLRDEAGTPHRVGGVSRIATHPDFCRQGHAGRLLGRALQAMEATGCLWSLLDTSEEGRPLYERLGWRAFPTSYRQGGLATPLSRTPHPYALRVRDPFREANGWEELARIHAAYNAIRPLTKVRDLHYWRNLFALGIRRWEGALVLTAGDPSSRERPVGYIIAHIGERGFLVAEAGCLPGHDAALVALLEEVAARSLARGGSGGRFHLPREPVIDATLARLLTAIHQGDVDTLMARPLSPVFDDAAIRAIFEAPGAMHWLLERGF